MTVYNVFQQIVSTFGNLRHILHAVCNTSVQFNMPSGFKREITLELRIHTQLNSVQVSSLKPSTIQQRSTVFYSSYNPALLHCVTPTSYLPQRMEHRFACRMLWRFYLQRLLKLLILI